MIAFSDDVRALLDMPGTFARLATVMADGAPQNTVIWFRRDGDALRMACGEHSLKARNIRRDRRVAVVVEHPDTPYHFVQIRGRAEVIDDDAVGRPELREISYRYIGRERGDAWMDGMDPSTIVALVIHPEKVSLFTDQEP